MELGAEEQAGHSGPARNLVGLCSLRIRMKSAASLGYYRNPRPARGLIQFLATRSPGTIVFAGSPAIRIPSAKLPFLLRPCFVHRQGSTRQNLSIQRFYSSVEICLRSQFGEGKASRTPGFHFPHNGHARYGYAAAGKKFIQFGIGHFERQVSYEQLGGHKLSIPI